MVKLDANGNKMWDKTFGGSDEDGFYCLEQTSDGGYILGGWSLSNISGDKTTPPKGGYDYWVIKLDANGNKIWDKTFGGSNMEEFHSLQQTSDGGFILGGWSFSGISGDKTQACRGDFDYWVVKLDSIGNMMWDKTIGGNKSDVLSSLRQTIDGGYILGGTSESGISGDKSDVRRGFSDFWVVKLDTIGNKIWDKTLGANSTEGFSSLLQVSDGGFILGGYSNSDISGDKTQDNKGGVNSFDYWIVKLAADVTGTNEPFSNIQISVSPNPSQCKFMLQLNDISASKVEVSVSDLLGRVILQNELPVYNKQVSEELEIKAAKGMYLLQVKTSNQSTSRKIIVE